MKTILSLLIAASLFAPMQSAQAARPAGIPPAHSNAGGKHAATSGSLVVNVTQEIADVGTLAGTLTIEGFIVDGGVIKAEGTLTATITDAAGAEVASVTDLAVTLSLTSTTGTTADALHLELGAVQVDVGGTAVTIGPVVVDLDAEASDHKAFSRLLALANRTLKRETANLRQIRNLLNLLLRLANAE